MIVLPPFPVASTQPDANFVALASSWTGNLEDILLGFVWKGYDNMRAAPPALDLSDLERSITQLLEPRIKDVMSGYEPFYVQHESFEHETKAAPPAQPPAYDLAFVLRADERVKWPLEAKVLKTPRTLTDYEKDVRQQFLTCRYAPFSESAAMLGYLLSGATSDALSGISEKLGCALEAVDGHPARPHKVSRHKRTVPAGKSYPSSFSCHHLILEFPGVSRASARRRRMSANAKDSSDTEAVKQVVVPSDTLPSTKPVKRGRTREAR